MFADLMFHTVLGADLEGLQARKAAASVGMKYAMVMGLLEAEKIGATGRRSNQLQTDGSPLGRSCGSLHCHMQH